MKRIQRSIERLESRHLMASDWQNQLLLCDVDNSSLVTPLDALIVINAINANGPHLLNNKSTVNKAYYVDVNGDNMLTPLDALVVINALNRALPSPNIAMGVDPASDPNANGVVLLDSVILNGQAGPNSTIDVELTSGSSSSPRRIKVNANQDGDFRVVLPLMPGTNSIAVHVCDELGRRLTTNQEIRRGDVVQDWNAAALNVIRDWTTTSNDPYTGRIVTAQPPLVARNLAMIQIAMFDAINAVDRQYVGYAFKGSAPAGTDPALAAAAAAHQVASTLYSDADERAIWDSSLNESMSFVSDQATRDNSIQFGRTVGDAILLARKQDGAKSQVSYVPGSDPGDWNRTEPDRLPSLLPQWPQVQPFAITNTIAYRPAPPPTLDSQEYANAVDQVHSIPGLHFWT